mgnify:FL=1
MVEGPGLENRHTWEGIGGSNPPSSDSLKNHMPIFFGSLTQLVECLAYNEVVSGSSPLTPRRFVCINSYSKGGYGEIGRHTRFRL